MRVSHVVLLAGLAAASALACAQNKLIEGRGTARNTAGLNAAFAFHVTQEGTNAALGRIEVGWRVNDVQIGILCEHPRFLGITEHQGRAYGPARVKVTRGTTVKYIDGTVYFTAWDLRPPEGGTHRDRIRVRFIRDPWGSPEGDQFFEGEVMDGDVVVRQS
ncbi:MAG: hypothetical protein JSS66_15200 [Armatimonadetes bacterium]|nr:hypothetical protein [Armatimonadota bacterium]